MMLYGYRTDDDRLVIKRNIYTIYLQVAVREPALAAPQHMPQLFPWHHRDAPLLLLLSVLLLVAIAALALLFVRPQCEQF